MGDISTHIIMNDATLHLVSKHQLNVAIRNALALRGLMHNGYRECSTIFPMLLVTYPPYQFIIKTLDFCLDN